MAKELAYVLINPYTISKSRTGGVIARYIARTDLDFVGARMYGPSPELVARYAAILRRDDPESPTVQLIAEYIERNYVPNPAGGRPRRVMLLLFEGEDAVRKIWDATGSATLKSGSGQTVRDTYGDYILDENGAVRYFEPAVLVAPTRHRAEEVLRLWARFAASDGGVIASACDVSEGESVEKTLVLLKPDNFRFRSARPGNIIDILSSSGLRIVGVKKFSMTVAQAEEFYGPVRESLATKFAEFGVERAAQALTREFGFAVPLEAVRDACVRMAPHFATQQFEKIVEFMTGYRPSDCPPERRAQLGKEGCLALVYDGVAAVSKIRAIIGSTDPSKAQPGSVRREFGSDTMVNAAHASDSPINALRELAIVRVGEDAIKPIVDMYYGDGVRTASPQS
jgi:nucleoside diphosphate kinase